MINVYKYISNTSVEGPGQRFCLWVQGCRRHCAGCYAVDSWDFGAGTDYSVEDLFCMIKKEKNIEGVTFLGGEPFEQPKDLFELSKKIKNAGLSIVCFTGYKIEELKEKQNSDINNFLNCIDLLIDGGFEKDKFDLSRPWVGSSNQRYIFLTNRYTPDAIKKYTNKIEVRISQSGHLELNGMGDFEKINKNFCLQLGKNKL